MEYTLIRSQRKTLAIHITPQGQVEVRAPGWMKKREIDRLLLEKQPWIEDKLAKLPKTEEAPALTPEELEALARQALTDLPARAARFAPLVGVSYGRIAIRCQKTRWGSCSSQGNLNFNCLLMLCPEEVRDCIVVHELCHRRHMNHSPAFWQEVARVLPGYREQERWLKENGRRIMARVPR